MAYLTIAGTTYRVRTDGSRGKLNIIENRERAIDGSLLVDRIAEKMELQVEILRGSTGAALSIAQANTLIGVLKAGNVAVSGDVGSFTARAKDIGYRDIRTGPGVIRQVSVTLEEV